MRRYDPGERGRLAALTGARTCPGCGEPTQVVLWSVQGALKSVCQPCDKHFSLTHSEFLDSGAFAAIPCPACQQPLRPEISARERGDYLLECAPCDHYLRLADLLPLASKAAPSSFTARRRRPRSRSGR